MRCRRAATCDLNAGRSPERKALRARALLSRRRNPDVAAGREKSSVSKYARSSMFWKATKLPMNLPQRALALRPSPIGVLTKSKPTTLFHTTLAMMTKRGVVSPSIPTMPQKQRTSTRKPRNP